MEQGDRKQRRFWRWWVLCLLCLGGVAAGMVSWAWFAAGQQQMVDGVPFYEWVTQHPDFQIRGDPLAKLGTNAVPGLVNILRHRPGADRNIALKQKLWSKLPAFLRARFWRWGPVPNWQVRRTALFGLRFLGPAAASALPEVLRVGRTETNSMVRAGALVAALSIAPNAPETFALWHNEWTTTNHFSRYDLATYIGLPRVPIAAAVPCLLEELTNQQSQAVQPAVQAFEYFGAAAGPAVPALVKLFAHGGDIRSCLLPVFSHLGPVGVEAVPSLIACLREQGPEQRTAFDVVSGTQITTDVRPDLMADTLRALAAMGPAARDALPQIGLLLTNQDQIIALLAAAAQVRIGGSTVEAMTVLLAGLEQELHGKVRAMLRIETPAPLPPAATYGPEAAALLCGELGEAAKAAVPDLERRLQDKSPYVRLASAQALWRINHKPEPSLRVLVTMLDSINAPNSGGTVPDDYELVRALDALGEMGPAARPAVPSIQRVRTFSMSGWHAANSALRRIASE